MGIGQSHAPKRVIRMWSDLRAGYSTLWFDRAQLRVWDNAHHLSCTMLPVVAISQLAPAVSNSRTARKSV